MKLYYFHTLKALWDGQGKIKMYYGMSRVKKQLSEKSLFRVSYINSHCVKSVRTRSYSSPYFPAFGLNTDQNNSECGQFLRSEL